MEFAQAGVVATVKVPRGQKVKAGDVLMELEASAGTGRGVGVHVVMTAVSGQMKHMFRTTGQADEILVMQAGAPSSPPNFRCRPACPLLVVKRT